MSYQIIYESGTNIKPAQKRRRGTYAFTLLFILGLLAFFFWDAGREVVIKLIFPGNILQTAEAAEAFAAELSSGIPFETALEQFCRQLMEQGSVY